MGLHGDGEQEGRSLSEAGGGGDDVASLETGEAAGDGEAYAGASRC